jgi:hypothetical protein
MDTAVYRGFMLVGFCVVDRCNVFAVCTDSEKCGDACIQPDVSHAAGDCALMAWGLFGESFTIAGAIGILLTATGVAFVVRR